MKISDVEYLNKVLVFLLIFIFVSLVILSNDAQYTLFSIVPFIFLGIYFSNRGKHALSLLKISIVILVSTIFLYFILELQVLFFSVALPVLLVALADVLLVWWIDRGIAFYILPMLLPLYFFSPIIYLSLLSSIIVGFYLLISAFVALFVIAHFPENNVVDRFTSLLNRVSYYGLERTALILIAFIIFVELPLWYTYQPVPIYTPISAPMVYTENSAFVAYPYFFSEYCPLGKNDSISFDISYKNRLAISIGTIKNGTDPFSLSNTNKTLPNLDFSGSSVSNFTFDPNGISPFGFSSFLGNCIFLEARASSANATAQGRILVQIFYFNTIGRYTSGYNGTIYHALYAPVLFVLNEYSNTTNNYLNFAHDADLLPYPFR